MTKTITAYHFMADRDGKPVLRDGRPCPAKGETLRHDGALGMCSAGLHASPRAIDALRYAPGPWVARVELGGKAIEDDDKVCAETRTIIAGPIDATALLREFAVACAYRVMERASDKITDHQRDSCLWSADIAMAIAAGAKIPDDERQAARSAAYAAATGSTAADAAADAAAYAAAAYAAANAADAAAAAYNDILKRAAAEVRKVAQCPKI